MPNKILLVDDDEDDRLLFTDALNELYDSLECEEANNGVEALKTLNSMPELPNIIFLDLNMPKMNGYDCLSELRKETRYDEIPVVIYTTCNIKSESERLLKYGAKYFFTKPSDYLVLKQELRKILEAELHPS